MALNVINLSKPYQVEKLRFYAFQHPYVCTFIEELQRGTIGGLLSLDNQSWRRDYHPYTDRNNTLPSLKPGGAPYFQHRYSPGGVVAKPYPLYNVDFELSGGEIGAYAQYNWELFFHIPLLIATRLMQDQRHEEAMRWFHYIFNPTTDSAGPVPERYWFFKPLRDLGQPESINQILQKLQDPAAAKEKKDEIDAQIDDWREHPFEPHRIARWRPGAYQKTVVMKYLDNLIAWGDKIFRRDTIESINEATQLYVLAAKLLGPRPHRVPEQVTPLSKTYAQLRPELDTFSNAVVALESIAQPFTPAQPTNGKSGAESLLSLGTLYFCIPHNDNLLRYWDTVADRLFKVRHCMNIEGVLRELPLFEPPIDPALLVRARAMGLDLSTILDDLSAPTPHYRFQFMLQKAREFCEELKQLGGLLLAALEKKDAEEIGELRATHEKALLKAVIEVRKHQVKEAEETVAGLERGKVAVELRRQHYETVSQLLPEEREFLQKQVEAVTLQNASQMAAYAGTLAATVPEVTTAARSVGAGVDTKVVSGQKVAAIANLVSTYLGWLGQIASLEGTTASYKGQLIRAQQDRDLQVKLASKELEQYDKQIAAADIRRQIAERELANHELQIEQADKIDEFLRDKFTSQDLYGWMSSQVSAVYFQAYRLAYDMAKRAERAYRIELGIEDSSFIQFGAWDSLRKGLLAGERLSLDLRRLEAAYLDQNKRTCELTKHVSLAQLDPHALILLRETGHCDVDIPEVLFDLDYPDHYMRRIKSVSLTIPSVTGPYTSVSCTLTLLKHQLRRTTDHPKNDAEQSFGLLQSIATSGGRNDAGLFELNFRDERRLPFEGAGVISTWRLELPAKVRQFDYDTISDVIFHVSYTALEGGGGFKKDREELVQDALNSLVEIIAGVPGLARAFSLRHDFPDEWHRLRQGQEVSLTIGRDRLPYFASVLDPTIQAATWLAKTVEDETELASLTVAETEITLQKKDEISPLLWGDGGKDTVPLEAPFTLSAPDAGKMEDLLLIITYTLQKLS